MKNWASRRVRVPNALVSFVFFVLLALPGQRAVSAEMFYLDHDAMSGRYTGPVGPLVLSGEIVRGDRAQLLAKIQADVDRFLSKNTVVMASTEGDIGEVLQIAALLESLHTMIRVSPLTGRCAGACFLIYVGAEERGSDAADLLGIASVPLKARPSVAEWLATHELPADLANQLWRSGDAPVYWLTDADERGLGTRSIAFMRYLTSRCDWRDAAQDTGFTLPTAGSVTAIDVAPTDQVSTDTARQAVQVQWACRARETRSDARAVLRRLARSAEAPRPSEGRQ